MGVSVLTLKALSKTPGIKMKAVAIISLSLLLALAVDAASVADIFNYAEEAFNAVDKDESGGISQAEFDAAIEELGIAINPKLLARLNSLAADFDADENKELSLEEIRVAIDVLLGEDMPSLEEVFDHLEEAFTAADTDESGGLSQDEIVAALNTLGIEVSTKLQRIIKCFAKDFDADENNELSMDEIYAAVDDLMTTL